ncbi:MAG TPA: VWA domain-containing protein [Polyangiaceae bacterium]|nr:VWA domain-containing protein [Polyangiaceae bacterium]
MKVKTVSYLAGAGMLLTSLSVWSFTEPRTTRLDAVGSELSVAPPENTQAANGAVFSTGRTLMLEGRLGHSRLLADKAGHTYMLFNVSAPNEAAENVRAPLNLAIVIDRSGSMKGKRLQNARDAALGIIQRLRSGDVLSVVTYNARTEVLVPRTVIDDSTRARAMAALGALEAQGDTCISCGLEVAQGMLAAGSGNAAARMLLLSDGEPTVGIRDLNGFRALAARVRQSGAAISSIGVDVEYNERTLAVLAQESNGRHHFVPDPSGLSRAFEAEFESLTRTVAHDAELTVELPPGLEVDEIFDRSFRREGRRIVAPLGSLAAGEQKTLLARVRLDASAAGELPVAAATLRFSDASSGQRGECSGALSLQITRDADELVPLDAVVAARLQRSETARTLTEANELFASGRGALAQQRLTNKLDTLKQERKVALSAAPAARARELENDFERQERALGAAAEGFAEQPPTAASAAPAKPQALRKGKEQVRSNQKEAVDLSF